MDGNLSSLGWSTTNQRRIPHQKKLNCKLGIRHLYTTQKINTWWKLLWMITYHPLDDHTPSLGWSPTIKNMVTNPSKEGHPFSKRWSATIHRMVTHNPQEGHQPSKNWSPTNPRKVTHHRQEGNPLFQGYGRTPSQWWVTHQQFSAPHHPWQLSPGFSFVSNV